MYSSLSSTVFLLATVEFGLEQTGRFHGMKRSSRCYNGLRLRTLPNSVVGTRVIGALRRDGTSVHLGIHASTRRLATVGLVRTPRTLEISLLL